MDKRAYHGSLLYRLLAEVHGSAQTDTLGEQLVIPPALLDVRNLNAIPRAIIAQALSMSLFAALLKEVPDGARYVAEKIPTGQKVMLDHGALRTVHRVNTGALPSGLAAFSRILAPLGFAVRGRYPMPALKMMGHGWCHLDHPVALSQFFVSELDVAQTSAPCREAADRVFGHCADPLTRASADGLNQLTETHCLLLSSAAPLLENLVECFARRRALPHLKDYKTLLAESAELAWIATEGNTFNHAADRVDNVHAVADAQRQLGRPMKDSVEISAPGTVMQTAYRAARVPRQFREADGSITTHSVPGSFFEFITRREPANSSESVDLRFDAANAQGIFLMTRDKTTN